MNLRAIAVLLSIIYIVSSQKNLSQNGTAVQKSTYVNIYHAKLAITGGPTNDWSSHSCSATAGNTNSEIITWWRLEFPVNTVYFTDIRIWYRNITACRLARYYLYVSNTTLTTDGYLCYHDEGPGLPSVNQTVECNHLGRYIIIYNERKPGVTYPSCHDNFAWLELCDVQVYGCYKTWYGSDCEKRCSEKCISQHCYPGNGSCVWGCNCLHSNCNKSATCTKGCEKPFAGPYCNKYNVVSDGSATQYPSPGTLQAKHAIDGDRTERECSKTSGPQAWWKVDTGGLSSIKDVYLTFKINEEENARDHALYLTNTSANWTNGIKLNMTTDFDTSYPSLQYNIQPVTFGRYLIYVPKQKSNGIAVVDICEVEVVGCPERRFGHGCNSSCPVYCEGTCHPDNGACSMGCYDGWTGHFCEQKCDATKFGKHCQNTCYCAKFPCNHVNGTCPIGGCQAGWEGITCSTACREGYFGFDCLERCDGCVNETCNRHTGECDIKGMCKPGWTGSKCDKECQPGMFGLQCASACHCLNNNPPCNHITGECPTGGCQRGYSEYNCSTECTTGKFGFNCKESCNGCLMNYCDRIHGFCAKSACKSGWKTDNGYCNIACDDGYFGDCLTECYCLDGICDKSTGFCTNGRCADGWQGETCSQECDPGTYGVNCGRHCVTCYNTTCERFEGNCTVGCIAGYEGHQCEIKVNIVSEPDSAESSPVGGIVGGIISAIVVVVLILVVIILLLRRRSAKRQEEETNRLTTPRRALDSEYINIATASTTSHELPSRENEDCQKTNPDKHENVYAKPDDEDQALYGNVTSDEASQKYKIQIKDLQSVILEKQKNNNGGFKDEYGRLPTGLVRPHTEGSKDENKVKNRFLSTWPYDHSRVVLHGNNSDYINASYIDSYSKDKAYIATQGPKKNTLKDFWHMVWQEKSAVIVMVTNLEEEGKKKCEKYWPETSSKPMVIGEYKISMREERKRTNCVYRKLMILNKTNKAERTVHHFHFTKWPDHGVPDKVKLISFYRYVRRIKSTLNCPMIVHCSAGVGRTGTFIAIDALYENATKTGYVDIMEYVQIMRKDRMNMIQTSEQYIAVFEALLEIFSVPETAINRNDFCDHVDNLQNNPKNHNSLRLEFQTLQSLKPSYNSSHFRAAKLPDNTRKNVVQNILPHDNYRPYLMSYGKGSNNYINAVIIPKCADNENFLVSQYPLKDTVVDFWTMVYDNDCTTVVLLEKISENVLLWPNNDDVFDFEKINIKKSGNSSVFIILNHKEKSDSRTIRVLTMDEWNVEHVPSSERCMLDILHKVSDNSRQYPGSVAVICQDGCRRSGVFVALNLIFEKLEMDDEVDIFQVVRSIQIRRPEFLSNFDQYEFCYQCVKGHLGEGDSLYANA